MPGFLSFMRNHTSELFTIEKSRIFIFNFRRRVRNGESVTRESICRLLKSYKSGGFNILPAALVVGSVINPDRSANQHIRAHALEGKSVRTVLEKHLRLRHIKVTTIVDRCSDECMRLLLGERTCCDE